MSQYGYRARCLLLAQWFRCVALSGLRHVHQQPFYKAGASPKVGWRPWVCVWCHTKTVLHTRIHANRLHTAVTKEE
jgi:hypothetical protein